MSMSNEKAEAFKKLNGYYPIVLSRRYFLDRGLVVTCVGGDAFKKKALVEVEIWGRVWKTEVDFADLRWRPIPKKRKQ